MPIRPIRVLVAKAPGRVRDGLCSLLCHQPQIRLVEVVQDEQALLKCLAVEPWNSVVLLDADICGPDLPGRLARLRLQAPHLRCILLVDTVEQQTRALAAGASDALIKGFSVEEFLAAIERAEPEPAGEARP